MSLQTLAVFPKSSNEEILFINGMGWTSDSKYLAYSARYKDELDIFVVTKDGSSWLNLTENIDGDA